MQSESLLRFGFILLWILSKCKHTQADRVESPRRSHLVAVPQDKLSRGKVVLLHEGQRWPPLGKCGAVHKEENFFI